MATKTVSCLVLLCIEIFMLLSDSVIPGVKTEEAAKYVLGGGQKSDLFSQCLTNARTVEGTLFSISVSEDEEYVRFVPKEVMEFDWTMLDLRDSHDIIACAQAAFELDAYMFKFDGNCYATVDHSYDPKNEQSCDAAASEVVFITTKPFDVFNGRVISLQCLYNSPQGMTYGEGGPLVSDVRLPTRTYCCTKVENGCLYNRYVFKQINYCEAEAFCEALNLPIASKSFFDDLSSEERANPNVVTDESAYMWIGLRKLSGLWLWVPEMVEAKNIDVNETSLDEPLCAALKVYKSAPPELTVHRCNETHLGVYCHNPNLDLPQCG